MQYKGRMTPMGKIGTYAVGVVEAQDRVASKVNDLMAAVTAG